MCGSNASGCIIPILQSGIQNGAPDGLALIQDCGGTQTVIEFISYEGVITATAGPASGMTSTDIGVAESGSTTAGTSLGLAYGVGSASAPETPGACPGTPLTSSPNPITVVLVEEDDMGVCPDPRIITRTWTATDDCGNEEEYVQTITIAPDTEMPSFVEDLPVAEIMLECDDAIPPSATLTAMDNCTDPILVVFDEVDDMGICPASRFITRTWKAMDACMNEVSHMQTITIAPDTEMPSFVEDLPAAEIMLECDDAIPPSVTLTAMDNCTDLIFTAFDEVDDMGACPASRIITRTWSAMDACMNEVSHMQTITIAPDIEEPTASDPQSISVMCSTQIPDPDITVVTDEIDNCSVPIVVFEGDVSDGNSCPETITRTYSVTDDCGNSIEVQQIITVGDDTPPTAGTPEPIQISCSDPIPNPDPNIIMGLMDNCTDGIEVTFLSDTSDGEICPEIITRVYQVTDACNNQIEVEQMIIINDSGAPSITNPPNIRDIEGCDSSALTVENAELVFADVETDITTFVITGGLNGLNVSDDCGIAAVTYIDEFNDDGCERSVTRTFTVTDICGFENSAFQFLIFDCTLASHGTLEIKAVEPGGN